MFIGISVSGVSIFDVKKKVVLKHLSYASLNQVKCFPTGIFLEDMVESKYQLNCNIAYQIQSILDEYIAILDIIDQ